MNVFVYLKSTFNTQKVEALWYYIISMFFITVFEYNLKIMQSALDLEEIMITNSLIKNNKDVF